MCRQSSTRRWAKAVHTNARRPSALLFGGVHWPASSKQLVLAGKTRPHRHLISFERAKVDLPAIESAKDLGAVNQKILAAVKNGKTTPFEGESFVNIVEKYRREFETIELSDRLDQLERIERERDSG